MNSEKKKRLEAAGWRVGTVGEFLGLSREEEEYIEAKLLLSECLKKERTRRRISQTQLARTIHSSQARVARMEASDPGVSIDLLMKALFAIGVPRVQIGRILSGRSRSGKAALA